MTQGKNNTDLTELLLKCMAEPDPMLSMLEWLCAQLMEAEVSNKLGAEKNEHYDDRISSLSGYRPRRYDTRIGTMYLRRFLRKEKPPESVDFRRFSWSR